MQYFESSTLKYFFVHIHLVLMQFYLLFFVRDIGHKKNNAFPVFEIASITKLG